VHVGQVQVADDAETVEATGGDVPDGRVQVAGGAGGGGGVSVRVVTGGEWHLAGVVGGAGAVEDWLPAITGAGSGVAMDPQGPQAMGPQSPQAMGPQSPQAMGPQGPQAAARPVTVRYEPPATVTAGEES
jgi:hypothetical protein